jgi:hypothetical protein
VFDGKILINIFLHHLSLRFDPVALYICHLQADLHKWFGFSKLLVRTFCNQLLRRGLNYLDTVFSIACFSVLFCGIRRGIAFLNVLFYGILRRTACLNVLFYGIRGGIACFNVMFYGIRRGIACFNVVLWYSRWDSVFQCSVLWYSTSEFCAFLNDT